MRPGRRLQTAWITAWAVVLLILLAAGSNHPRAFCEAPEGSEGDCATVCSCIGGEACECWMVFGITRCDNGWLCAYERYERFDQAAGPNCTSICCMFWNWLCFQQ
jgi:hypothetical protein